MLRFLIILFYLLFFSDVAYTKDYLGLMNDLEKSKEANISVDLDAKSKQYGYKNFKSFVKDFKKKNNIKRLSTEDARIYFAGYDPTLQIIESKENLDKLHELILNNKTLRRHTSYFKKKNSDKVKWLAVAVDYKKEMAKITKDSNLKKISPFPWGWSPHYAGAAIINCEREKYDLGIKIGPECILVDISKNKEHLNVILPIDKIEMCKENSQRLFPDLYTIADKEFRDKRYKSYCQSKLFSLPGIPDNERTPNLIKKQIKKNEFLYSKLEENNPLLIKVKKDEKEKKIDDINITNETKAVKIENIVSDSNSNLIKVDNKNQSVVEISANDTEPSKSFDLKVNAVICTFDKKGQTEYSNMLGLMVSIDKCPESGHYKQIKYKMAAKTGYRHHLKKNLCYNPDKNKIKMKSTKCKDNEFYLKYKSENNKDIFYYNSANKKLNPELIAKKKEKKVDKKKNNSKNKDQEWFSEHNEVNSWHEPINLYSKYWHSYLSQFDINHSIEKNLGYVWLGEPVPNYPKTSSELADLYIGQRIIEPIEGIWQNGKYKIGIVKQEGNFLIYAIDQKFTNYYGTKIDGSGFLIGTLINKDQENNYFGYEQMYGIPGDYENYAYFCGGPVSYFLKGSNKVTVTQNKKYTGCKKNEKLSLKRVWPKDLEAHNNKFKKSDTSIVKNKLEEKYNLNVIMQKKPFLKLKGSIFSQDLDNKIVIKPNIKKLYFNDCIIRSEYLKELKQLLYLSNDGVSRTIEEIYETNGVINIRENLLDFLKQYLEQKHDFKGELKSKCPQHDSTYTRRLKSVWQSVRGGSGTNNIDFQYEILVLPKGLKTNQVYTVDSSGRRNYALKELFEKNRFLGTVFEIDINEFNTQYLTVNTDIQKSRDNKKNESELARSLASKNERSHVLMYTLNEPSSYSSQVYCFINKSNNKKWDPPLAAYIHYGTDNFHTNDFKKYIDIEEHGSNNKDRYVTSLVYDENNKEFYFRNNSNYKDKTIIATSDDINELFLGIKAKEYKCSILVGYPPDLVKIIDGLKRDNFFKLEFLPLQGKLRKVSTLNDKYDQVVKLWEEYYENERKRQAMNNQAYQEKYGKLINKHPNCATTYYYIKGRMAQFSYNSWQYNKLNGLKRNIEGLVSATGSADDYNSRAHCQNFLIMAYNTN